MNSSVERKTLSLLFPEISSEWDYYKNKDLSPDTVTIGSGKKVWWKCNRCGNEWEATICNRTKRGSGCPECAKQLIAEKKNKSLLLKNGSFEDWCMALSERILRVYEIHKEKITKYLENLNWFTVTEEKIDKLVKYRDAVTHGGFAVLDEDIGGMALVIVALIYCCILKRMDVDDTVVKELFDNGLLLY